MVSINSRWKSPFFRTKSIIDFIYYRNYCYFVMFEKIGAPIIVSILLLSLLMGCTNPISENSSKNNSSSFPVYVFIGDDSCGDSAFNVTVWIDNMTVIVWDHPVPDGQCPEFVSADKLDVRIGNHTVRAFEKTKNITNSTSFNLNKTLYIKVSYDHPDTQYPSTPPPRLFFDFSDRPFG